MRPHRAGFLLVTLLAVCAPRPAQPMEGGPFRRAGRPAESVALHAVPGGREDTQAQAASAAAGLQPSQAAAARVRLVATGGTISNRTGGRLTAEDLVQSMPGLERYVRPEFEQFSNVASSELTLDQWLALARRLNEIFATDAGISGLVVTSGTDTLDELAYFLNLTVRSEKPVASV